MWARDLIAGGLVIREEAMQIQINSAGVRVTDEVTGRVEREVRDALKHVASQVTRVEVHLEDHNGPKAGVHLRCLIEVRLAGLKPMVVEHLAPGAGEAITGAAGKLERAVEHRLGRLRDRRPSA
jgi:ribosome-associated translation inhibitor RaiA